MSAGLVDNFPPSGFQQLPHRKPLPPGVPVRPISVARYLPDQQQQQPQQQQQQQQLQQQQLQQAQQYSGASQLPQQLRAGSRASYSSIITRPSSSSTMAVPASPSSYSPIPQNTNPVSYQAHMNQHVPTTKRTLSNATTSTSSTGGTTKINSSASSTLQRSTSATSNQPTSYVALLRKQKATVWCDRAQQEDPRVLAQQRAAKMRAAMEVSNINTAGRTSTSGSSAIRSKMRHHGAPKAQQYTPNSHPASGVPMRLSAREVDEDDSDDDSGHNARGGHNNRSGSGRSSVGSGKVGGMYTSSQQGGLAVPGPGSTTSSAAGNSPVMPRSSKSSSASSPQRQHQEYFGRTTSTGSADDEELNFGGVGGLPQRLRGADEEEQRKQDLADLRRRGSVDERTMTMSGYGRLYVANPDID